MSRKTFGFVVLLIITLIMLLWGAKWVHYRLTHAITNAVFVETDSLVKVAYKRTAGRIEKLFKEEGDEVKKGEPLAKLEDADYRIKLKELDREMESLKKQVEALKVKRTSLEKEIRTSMKLVELKAKALEGKLKALDAQIEQLKRDRNRLERLYTKGVVPKRRLEEVETKLKALTSNRSALLGEIRSVHQRSKVLEAKLQGIREIDKRIEALNKKLEALSAKREDLQNLLEETFLRSPIDGFVVKRFVAEGEVVRQGQFIYAVYDPKDLYILVLLEETKLEGVKPGNKAYIKIDAFPDEEFVGEVEEINRATAAKFALIPRDITAGEFTKVAQRIPVKIRILEGNTELLRVGMGGEVAIELVK